MAGTITIRACRLKWLHDMRFAPQHRSSGKQEGWVGADTEVKGSEMKRKSPYLCISRTGVSSSHIKKIWCAHLLIKEKQVFGGKVAEKTEKAHVVQSSLYRCFGTNLSVSFVAAKVCELLILLGENTN